MCPNDLNNDEIDIEGFKIRIDELIDKNLIPKFFKTPYVGSWEITRACNLRCIYCYNNSGKKLPNELSHEQKLDVAKQIVEAKIFRMCISGGEPILSESFWDIVKILNEGHVICNTISNGFASVNEDNVEKFLKYFAFVQISIDSATPEIHDKLRGRKGSWKNAINSAKLVAENKGKLSIAMVATPINIGDMGKMIDLTYELGAEEFRVDKARLLGKGAINQDCLDISEKQSEEYRKIIDEKKKEYEGRLRIDAAPDYLGSYVNSFSNLPPMVIYISPTGTCGVDPNIPFSGGSLKDKTLAEVWDNLKRCHKNAEYIKYARILKTGKDFIKLDEIPYVEGELHDE